MRGSDVRSFPRQRGFSLIELMIAVTLGLMIVAVVLGVFLSGNKSYREDDRFAQMQENGRFAMKVLAQDLAMSGFWGNLDSPSSVSAGGLAAICNTGTKNITFDSTQPLAYLRQPTAAQANAAYSCIDATEFSSGDVLAIQRVQGGDDTPAADKVYLVTSTTGTMTQWAAGGPEAGKKYWQYVPHIYFIRNYAATAGDGVPALCRKTLNNGSPLQMIGETGGCLAEGIENFHVEFGIDTDTGAPDGLANIYTSAPTATELKTAVSARLWVLVRSRDADPAYTTDNRTFTMGDVARTITTAANDHYYRRVFSTTVALRDLTISAVCEVVGE